MFAAIVELLGKFAVEEDDRFTQGNARFDSPEAENVHPRAPGKFGRRTSHGSRGIGKAGPIHVNVQSVKSRQTGNFAYLLCGIKTAKLGWLRQAHHARFWIVDVRAPQDHAFDSGEVEFAIWPRRHQDLCSIGKELGCAALIRLDMRGLVTNNAMVAPTHRSQRERVGGRSIEDKIDITIGLEDLTNHVGRAGGMTILSVRGTATFIRVSKRLERFGTKPSRIVAGKVVSLVHCGGYSLGPLDASSEAFQALSLRFLARNSDYARVERPRQEGDTRA